MAAKFVAVLALVASARAGIIGSPLLGSPLGIAGARAISVQSGLPLGVASPLVGARLASPLGVPVGLAGAPLGIASPLGVQVAGARLASPLGLPVGVAGAPLGLASPLGVQVAGARLASPLGLSINAGLPLGARLASPVGIAKTVIPTAVDTDYDPNPSYSYAYDVQDALTGDSKNQQESRQGDVVQGSYSLTEPDGTRRTVEYTADPINGFNAVVHREPLAIQKVVAAPAIAKVAAPLGYAPQLSSIARISPLGQTIIG